MIRRILSRFWLRAMAIWDALGDFRLPSAQLWVPQEGLPSPPFPMADGPDVVQLRATDSASGTVKAATAFQLAVLNLNPSSYWALTDTNGVNAYDQTGNGNTGTLNGGVTANVAGPFPNTSAMEFSAASSGWISTAASVDNPTVYTIVCGFKTTSASAVLVQFASPQTNPDASNYDRMLYIDDTGLLRFGAYSGSTVTVASPSAVDDGNFHLAVGAMSSTSGMTLFLDGSVVGTNANTSSQAYTGWWHLGGGNTTAWPGGGYPFFLTGTEGQVATWDTIALTTADMANLWTAWQSSVSG